MAKIRTEVFIETREALITKLNRIFARICCQDCECEVSVHPIRAGEQDSIDDWSGRLVEGDDFGKHSLEDMVKLFETKLIIDALIISGGRQNAAAKLLGIKKTTLNSKIKRYQIPVGKTAIFQIENYLREGK